MKNLFRSAVITAIAFMIMFFVSISVNAQITVFSEPGTTQFKCGAYVEGAIDMVCFGGDGGIWRTADANFSLSRVFTTAGSVYDMMFVGQTGYALLSDGVPNTVVFKTFDGGVTWNQCYVTPDGVRFKHLYVKSPTEVFANFSGASSNADAQLYRSTDGGLTWNVVLQTRIYAFEGVAGDGNNVFVTGSLVWSSVDLTHWSMHSNPTVFPFSNAVYSAHNNRLYVGGDAYLNGTLYPTIAYSTNKGVSWTNFNFPDSGLCWNISFGANGIGYAHGDIRWANYNWFAITMNKGDSWERIYLTSTYNISNVCASVNYGYGLGSGPNSGIIIRYDSKLTGTGTQGSLIPEGFELKQNYPNPFNPATKIQYSLPKNSMVTLKVFDISGKEISTLVHGMKNAGEHSVEFNGANLASGIYFYTVQAGDFKATKKMILTK